MNYRVDLDLFEGPPDFLLYLVEEGVIAAGDVPVGEMVRRYVEELERRVAGVAEGNREGVPAEGGRTVSAVSSGAEEDPETSEAGEILRVSAALLWRKARMLWGGGGEGTVPAEESVGDGERRAALARKLALYGRVKEAAGFLARREAVERQRFQRLAAAGYLENADWSPPGTAGEGLSPGRLWEALRRLREREPGEVRFPAPQELTINGVIAAILARLGSATADGDGPPVSLSSFPAPGGGSGHLIVFFLGLLELIRRGMVAVAQEGPFGEIFLRRVATADSGTPPASGGGWR